MLRTWIHPCGPSLISIFPKFGSFFIGVVHHSLELLICENGGTVTMCAGNLLCSLNNARCWSKVSGDSSCVEFGGVDESTIFIPFSGVPPLFPLSILSEGLL